MENRVRSNSEAELRLDDAVHQVFSTPAGKHVLDWMKLSYVHTILGPEATDAGLRYREGQRSVVAALLTRIERAKHHG